MLFSVDTLRNLLSSRVAVCFPSFLSVLLRSPLTSPLDLSYNILEVGQNQPSFLWLNMCANLCSMIYIYLSREAEHKGGEERRSRDKTANATNPT